MSSILLLLQRVHQNVHQTGHTLAKKTFQNLEFTLVVLTLRYGMSYQKNCKIKRCRKIGASIINLQMKILEN
jgi:hypothetical protein